METKIIRYIIIFIDAIFALIALVNIMELVDILIYKEFYPFGAEFFGPYSIYKSRQTYVIFKSVFTVLIALLVASSVLRLRRAFWLLAFLNACLALYMYASI